MLQIEYIRSNKQKVINAAKNKNRKVDIDKILVLDDKRKEHIQTVQKLREERNASSKQKPDEKMIERGKHIKEELKRVEDSLANVEDELKKLLYEVPNVPFDHIQIGDEAQNRVLRQEGKVKIFNFPVKDHVELGENLDIIDIPRAVKVSGTRFAYLKNEGALLELALAQFAMQRLFKLGFTTVTPPAMIKREMTEGLGYWHGGGNGNFYLLYDYEIENDKQKEIPYYLIGTGEHSVVPMHSNEFFTKSELPKRYAAFSSCFRRETGTYGKDTRGILRVHQFEKVEMVSFVKPEDDEKERKKLLTIAESFLKDLELPYQVVQLSTGDLSFPAAETIDIETWIPSQDKYRETHSISTTTDFQSRRLKIKYKENQNTDSKFVHILNGTALALGRIIIAILENNQQANGSITIPKVLHPFTGFTEIKKR